MRFSIRFAAASCGLAPLLVVGDRREAGKPEFHSLAEVDAHYRQQANELDRRKLLDMAAVAGRMTGMEAEDAYRAVFDMAVARSLFNAAEPTAHPLCLVKGPATVTCSRGDDLADRPG